MPIDGGEEWALRPWVADDRHAIYEIATDPEARRFALREGTIPWEEHSAWFGRALAEGRPYFVIEVGGEVAGYVRFDEGTVSIALHPAHRGRGLASKALSRAVRELAGEQTLTAYVRPDNAASLALFRKVGFSEHGVESVNGVDAVRFVREVG